MPSKKIRRSKPLVKNQGGPQGIVIVYVRTVSAVLKVLNDLRNHFTFVTMGAAWMAISGIFPFSGFWSKDEILAATFARGGGFYVLWAVGLLAALLTAFYMTRLFVMTFLGKPRWDGDVAPHESPRTMTIPLLVLAIFTVWLNTDALPWAVLGKRAVLRDQLAQLIRAIDEGAATTVNPNDGFQLSSASRAADGAFVDAHITISPRRPIRRSAQRASRDLYAQVPQGDLAPARVDDGARAARHWRRWRSRVGEAGVHVSTV